MKRGKRILITITLLSAAALLTALSACSPQVNALDYNLENQLYDEQPQPQETASAQECPADNPQETPLSEIISADRPEELAPEESPPENTEGESKFLYTVCVLDQCGESIEGARVTLYADGVLLYSAITSADGCVTWMLPAGCIYTAKADVDGYVEAENGSRIYDNQADVCVKITLNAPDQAPKEPDKAELADPSATPVPVPTTDSGNVTVIAEDTSIQAGDTEFSLLDGITAKDEAGNDITAWVVSDGGFSINVPGKYVVSYAVMQGDVMVSACRVVTVTGIMTEEEPRMKASAPSGSSNTRYQRLLTYRNKIYEELSSKMQALSFELDETIKELTTGETNVRLMAEALEDGAELDKGSDFRQIEAAAFTQVEQLSVRNWADILAVFIAKSSLDVEDPLDLMQLWNISLDGLDEVFWDMNKIKVLRTDDGLNVLLVSESYEETAEKYSLSEKQTDLLYTLMQPEFLRVFASLTGNTAFDELTSAQIQTTLSQLPKDLSIQRESVVAAAYSLVGKVTYFWGGKYNLLGWNPGWGLPRTVTSSGSKTTGKVRAYGLDCSGFVSWVFINATKDTSVLNVIGSGSTNQWENSASIGWDEGQPGDLAFLAAPGKKDFNHVGIIVSVEGNSYLVAHCSSSQNGIVVTEAWSSGFRYLRRPLCFRR